MEILKQRIVQAFQLTYDFYHQLNEDDLKKNIVNSPSNTIGEQVYCIIGARESYLAALKVGEWTGFNCSLSDCLNKTLVVSKLVDTQHKFVRFFDDKHTSEMSGSLLINLLEHEIQHHGQLIRYAYANKIKFPKSWNRRYTV
ncbi:hypothetical protein LCL95_01495 [Bacillus timonensis]|nr:hypothetical protein [Bacillus timonensis]